MEDAVTARFGDWIGEGWKMFVEQWQTWVLNALIVFGILAVPIAPIVVFLFVLMGMSGSSPDMAGGALGGIFLLECLALLLITVISSYFGAGLCKTALKQLRGQRIAVSDVFSGGDCFLRVLGAGILGGILASIGFLLCIVPGFLVAGALLFTQFLIVDQGLGVIEAMQKSYELCKKHIWWFTLFALVLGFISQAGSYACYVGLLATYPLYFTMAAVAYRDCFDIPGMRYFRDGGPGSAAAYNPGASYLPPAPAPRSFMPPAQPGSGQPAGYQPAPMPPSFVPPQGPNNPPGPWPEQGYTPSVPPPPPMVPPSPQPPGPEPVIPPSTPQNIETPGSTLASCPSCRTPLTPSARFCPRCGTPVSGSGGPGSANV